MEKQPAHGWSTGKAHLCETTAQALEVICYRSTVKRDNTDGYTFNTSILFTGREIRIGKTVPVVLGTARGWRPLRAEFNTKGTVRFTHAGQPRLFFEIHLFKYAKTDRKDGHVAFKASCRLVKGFFLTKVKLI